MRILHLNTSDSGGAGYAALRLHTHLRDRGIDSRMLVVNTTSAQPGVTGVHVGSGAAVSVFGGRFITRYLYDYDRYFPVGTASAFDEVCAAIEKDGFSPDIIVCHWTSRFVTAQDIRRLSERFGAPVLLHMVDMAHFTGGCHYSLGCLGYEGDCGNCPAIVPRGPSDLSNRQMREKKAAFANVSLSAVATCEYVFEQTQRASFFRGRNVYKVLYGIDPERFKPADRRAARALLGLPADRRVVFAGAQDMKNRRKGMRYLTDALRLLAASDLSVPVTVAIAGPALPANLPAATPMVDYKFLGQLDANTTMITLYQAVDAFICPSIEDAGPMMTSEAIMCGTPVVSFDMGVARDLVHTGRTGYRARLADAQDLMQGIRSIVEMDDAGLDTMSRECRDLGLQLLHPDVQVGSFIRIFESMLTTAPIKVNAS